MIDLKRLVEIGIWHLCIHVSTCFMCESLNHTFSLQILRYDNRLWLQRGSFSKCEPKKTQTPLLLSWLTATWQLKQHWSQANFCLESSNENLSPKLMAFCDPQLGGIVYSIHIGCYHKVYRVQVRLEIWMCCIWFQLDFSWFFYTLFFLLYLLTLARGVSGSSKYSYR